MVEPIFGINYPNVLDLLVALKKRVLRAPQEVAMVGSGDEFLASMIGGGLQCGGATNCPQGFVVPLTRRMLREQPLRLVVRRPRSRRTNSF